MLMLMPMQMLLLLMQMLMLPREAIWVAKAVSHVSRAKTPRCQQSKNPVRVGGSAPHINPPHLG